MAVITTAAFAIQLVIFKSKFVGIRGAICEGLALSFAFFAAKDAGARACDRLHIQGHHNHCGLMTILCAFSVLIVYYPLGVSACFCFCLLGMPTEMLWFGERKRPTHNSTTGGSAPNQSATGSVMAAELLDEEEKAHGTAITPTASCQDSMRPSRTNEEDASSVPAAAPTRRVHAQLQGAARWAVPHGVLVRNGGDCGPDAAAWLLKHHGPALYQTGPLFTRDAIRRELQQAWKNAIADDPSCEEARAFIFQRLDQVPEARDKKQLQAQVAVVLQALLRQESDQPFAEDHNQITASQSLPYWFLPTDWAQLSKHFQVDFVIHGMPGTEARACDHCGATGHVHTGWQAPGIDMCLHVHWRGAGQANADDVAWGHWEPLVPIEKSQVEEPGARERVQEEVNHDGSATRAKQAVQAAVDAVIAAQLQQEEQHGASDGVPWSVHGSSKPQAAIRSHVPRSDNEMKELLQSLCPPHFVHASKTHGQNACLIDSILLALQDKQLIQPLTLDERAAVCKSIRLHLVDHHGLPPPAPDGSHSFLSHEDHFEAIGQQLREAHCGIWVSHVDFSELSISAVVFDRFHRRQIFDIDGTAAGELPETHAPVLSAPQNATQEVCIQLYCNTAEDGFGTPYHYEWISSSAPDGAEDGESDMDSEDEDDNPAPPLPVLPLRAPLSSFIDFGAHNEYHARKYLYYHIQAARA